MREGEKIIENLHLKGKNKKAKKLLLLLLDKAWNGVMMGTAWFLHANIIVLLPTDMAKKVKKLQCFLKPDKPVPENIQTDSRLIRGSGTR